MLVWELRRLGGRRDLRDLAKNRLLSAHSNLKKTPLRFQKDSPVIHGVQMISTTKLSIIPFTQPTNGCSGVVFVGDASPLVHLQYPFDLRSFLLLPEQRDRTRTHKNHGRRKEVDGDKLKKDIQIDD